MTWWWSYLLAAVGILGLYLAGSRNRAGWAVGVGAQALWIGYAFASAQYGFLASAAAYAWVYARNYLRWRREARTETQTGDRHEG
jgi:hypothetical protein